MGIESIIEAKDKLKEKITGRKVLTEEEQEKINIEFMNEIAPQGGITFDVNEKLISTGTGYEACIYVYGYPKQVSTHWLSLISNIEDTICVLDISSRNKLEVQKNLKRSLEEQSSRYNTAKSTSEAKDAQKQFQELEEMYEEINNYGDVMKQLLARIYVSEKTLYDLDVKVKETIASLGGSGFKCAVCVNETHSDWRNMFLSYSQQQQTIYNRIGQPLLSKTLAAGDPFHFSSLCDPNGTYLGSTDTGGAVLFDLFHKDNMRMSYDFITVGKKGAGKSTTLKKLLTDRAARGDIVRVFDVTGEFTKLCNYLGGSIISLDGTKDSIINILQILPAESQTVAFNKHVSKVTTIYTYLKAGNVEEKELLVLKILLRLLYKAFGICNIKGDIVVDLKQLSPKDFPKMSDLLNLTKEVIDKYDSLDTLFSEVSSLRKEHIQYLQDIELKISDLCSTYGNIFDGYTSVEDFYETKIVCFDMRNLAAMEETVYDAQLYNALSVCWDNCVLVGAEMNELYSKEEIGWEDITRSLILIDEAHKSINANKMAGVKEVVTMMREGRKYFTGIGLASQSIRDYVPDNAASEAVELMRVLFELTTYKFIMNQDSNAIPKLKEVFQNTFSELELSKIPKLMRRECILSIAGDKNIEMTIYAPQVELELFNGGV